MTKTECIPQYLKDHGLFCLWRYETREGQDGEPERTKVPYNPNDPRRRGGSNDRAKFSDLATAAASADGFDGLGVGVFDGIAGIDIDHCLSEDGMTDMAASIVMAMDSYTEVSPSGTGLRIFFRATGTTYDTKLYYINNRKAGPEGEGLEVYLPDMTNKYMTITGDVVVGGDLQERGNRLPAILEQYMKRPPKPEGGKRQASVPIDLDDADLLHKAMNARNGWKFKRLWDGDTAMNGDDDSRADLALCNMLAYWTGCDEARMDALFRQSGLMRDKWDRMTGQQTYGDMTIQKAVDGCTRVYDPARRAPDAPQAPRGAEGRQLPQNARNYPQKDPQDALGEFLEEVQGTKYKPVATGMQSFDKLVGGGITRQSLVVLSAMPGAGKTALMAQLAEQMAGDGQGVLYFNLEMSRQFLLARSLSKMLYRRQYLMSATDILRGYAWSDDQKAHVLEAAEEYAERIAPNLVYNPNGGSTDLHEIMSIMYSRATEDISNGMRAPVVVVDYLHLLTVPGKESGEVIKEAVAMLKAYAIEFDTFVLAIGANNRSSNSSGTITQSSGRDSSALEYTADLLLSLNFTALEDGLVREKTGKRYRADDPDDMDELMRQEPRKMTARVLKNRMAAVGGRLDFDFYAAHSLFVPIEKNTKKYPEAGGIPML